MIAVSAARARMRRNAVANDASTDSAKRAASLCVCVNACTVETAFSFSPASALESATRSCVARESFRTLRPNTMMGSTTTSSSPMV